MVEVRFFLLYKIRFLLFLSIPRTAQHGKYTDLAIYTVVVAVPKEISEIGTFKEEFLKHMTDFHNAKFCSRWSFSDYQQNNIWVETVQGFTFN